MPSTSEKQRRFMGAELARKRSGESTETGMSESQLSDFASKTKHAKKVAKHKKLASRVYGSGKDCDKDMD